MSERRKGWRLLQSKAGITNKDCEAQKVLLQKVDAEEIPMEELFRKRRVEPGLTYTGERAFSRRILFAASP